MLSKRAAVTRAEGGRASSTVRKSIAIAAAAATLWRASFRSPMKALRLLFSIALAALGAHADGAEDTGAPARPNFVVIMAEAQGWASSSVRMDDAVAGSRSSVAITPSLEKLAAGGMRFANFYAASPRCTPTRAAFFTGRSPAALHMTFVNEGRGGESGFPPAGSKLLPPRAIEELPEAETTIAELLKREGYATAHFGKWHVGRASPARHGFEESDGPNNNGGPENVENPNPKQAFEITARGVDFMERQVKAGKPFYLQISHYPGRGGTDARPETYADLRRRATTQRDQRMVGSAAVTQDMDATIGLLLAKLEAPGLAGRTYFIYTADHGAQGRNANGPLANGKGTVWEGGLRVPLIVRGPGVSPGVCTHVRASTVDLFPTLAALAGVKEPALPKWLEGGSLGPVLGGLPGTALKRAREEFVVHFPHYDRKTQSPASVLLLGNDKLIRLYESGVPMLFDVAKDLSETHDLAPEQPARAAELNRRLSDYLKAVNAQMPTPNPAYEPGKTSR
jgi:arylsulfatase A